MRDTTSFIDQNTPDCIEVCPGSLIGDGWGCGAVRTGGIRQATGDLAGNGFGGG